MAEILASLDDINLHLPEDKAVMESGQDDPYQVSVTRIVRGALSGVYTPVTLNSWDSPGDTPGYVREIAGRLIAAIWYAKLYSEDIVDLSEYAQFKYNEAMAMLERVRLGEVVLIDEDDPASPQGSLTSDDFWPNDSTTPGPVFTMSQVFS